LPDWTESAKFLLPARGASCEFAERTGSGYFLATLGRVLVLASEGQKQVPLARLANINAVSGPSMIRDEDGLLTGCVYVDIEKRDLNSYIEEAQSLLKKKIKLPP
jgi:Cu(I)/Ag(I) efflux system membrane protein CusA/SilA